MKVYISQHKAFKKLFPVQMPQPGQFIRPFDYLLTEQVPEGLLVYQASLCDLVLLEGDEQALLRSEVFPDDPSETLRWLLEHRFLVPADHDDYSFCRNVRAGARLVRRLTNEEEGYSGFTILTTTACNARCFYCFEKGVQPETMTLETAAAVADFILKEGKQKHVSLSWFGGEPTVNARVIDQISEALADAGREFTSSMISNGYLLDEELVKKAADLWKLKSIQITMDGTEEIYNERKNYVGIQGSAFQTVMHNIGLLLDAGIEVQIRLNVDAENADDLCALAGQLNERFRGRGKLSVYSIALFEDDSMHSSYQARLQASDDVHRCLEELGFSSRGMLDGFPKTFSCMADSGISPVIMPDGSLKSCEHINASPNWGSVFQPGKRSEDLNAFWNELKPEQPECRSCPALPTCIRLTHCDPLPQICTEEIRAQKCRDLSDALRNTWRTIKAHASSSENRQDPDASVQ